MNWYKILKLADQVVEIPQEQFGKYLSIGHDGFTKNPYDNPSILKDALWLFSEGKLEVVTMQDLVDKGHNIRGLTHNKLFPNIFTPGPKWLGRYDADKNEISLRGKNVPVGSEIPDIVLKNLYKRFGIVKINKF